ncbi:hypothetical protein [Novosphingobium mathurense]|uniref:Uncharacterized protein n=1 Tax=Novosphingobium mathurense TaxID=428990 RepID=A0A1U6INM7_9SPHN|nr:hypothetical protein [Novosphingobium mathurense]SLK09618.1 hypothetical protein SAMN06295987_11023 [Novosphingobium mathurense]
MIGASHLALAGALAACLSGIGGFAYGTRIGLAQERAAQKRADDAADAVRRKLQGQIDASAERAQAAEFARQSSVREIYHESQKVIERPVYRNVCIDADGVRLLDRSAAIANAEGLGQPSGSATAPAQAAAQ